MTRDKKGRFAKRSISALVVILIVIFGGITWANWFVGQDLLSYQAPQATSTPEVVTVEVNGIDEKIKQRNAELEADYRTMQNLEATIDVLDAEIARLETQKQEAQKNLASFMETLASEN